MSDARSTLAAALPPLIVVTDRTQVPAGRSLLDQVRGCIDGGARCVLLREKDLPRDERRVLAAEIKAMLDEVDGLLIVASDRYLAADVGVAGCHGNAASKGYRRAKDPAATRRPSRRERHALVAKAENASLRWGLSCHAGDDLHEVAESWPTYVTISPIFATASKPGYGPALEAEGLLDYLACFRAVFEIDSTAAGVAPPQVYALGGIDTPERAAECFAAGADGVAVMGALMRADDPTAATGSMLAAAPKEPAR